MAEAPHSEFIITDCRDDWWNNDFLALMASRLRLGAVHRVLDVGCGHGHWGQLWAQHFADDATLVGIDREDDWVAKAQERSKRFGLQDRFTYQRGDAQQLPVTDTQFDLVTCQTVLMHLANPARAIDEMKRALEPGGLMLLAEPCNPPSLLIFDSLRQQASLDDTLELIRFHLICNQGRIALGEGDHTIGARLPEMLAQAGLVDIQVHLNDCAAPVYASRENTPQIIQAQNETVESIEAGKWLWGIEEARRFYLAGAGLERDFDTAYGVFMADARAFVSSVRDDTYYTGGGGQQYLISARRAGSTEA